MKEANPCGAVVSTASADYPALRKTPLPKGACFANQKHDYINKLSIEPIDKVAP
jgi:hypothetical protein